jgi:hypothetical protein
MAINPIPEVYEVVSLGHPETKCINTYTYAYSFILKGVFKERV